MTPLYSFAGGTDGNIPVGSLAADKAGNLYGVTYFGGAVCNSTYWSRGCGTVFELSPPSPNTSAWTEKIIWRFTGAFGGGQDGLSPYSPVVDPSGALFLATKYGGVTPASCSNPQSNGCGTVIKLTPPAAGQTSWTETVLHAFQGILGDGLSPSGAPTFDGAGNIFIATATTIVQLSPPKSGSTAWTSSVLYTFPGGVYTGGSLVQSGTGSLYGVTYIGGATDNGYLYQLLPPGAASNSWTTKILVNFPNPVGGGEGAVAAPTLTIGGALYGTTNILTQVTGGGGTLDYYGTAWSAHTLKPSGNAWLYKTIRSNFESKNGGSGPEGSLIADANGVLFGALLEGGTGSGCPGYNANPGGCGLVYKLLPPTGTRKVWLEAEVFDFANLSGAPSNPSGGLYADARGSLFGVTERGGVNGLGAVYEITGSGYHP